MEYVDFLPKAALSFYELPKDNLATSNI